MRYFFVFVFTCCLLFPLSAQIEDEQNGFRIFTYPSGQKASEGILRQGKPDGFWISYYPGGTKKSEGNRKNFLLDSTWVFFNHLGDTVEKADYLMGKKNGFTYKFGYRNDRIGKDRIIVLSRELYLNDKLEGVNYYYNADGSIREIVRYKDGKRDGLTFQFGKDSTIIAALDYRKDYLVQSERINRIDSGGKKQGLWREYFADGKIKSEAFYRDGLMSGIYKQFNEKGSLEIALNYRNGIIEEGNREGIEKEVTIKNEYSDDEKLVFSGAFIDSIPVGIHRYYNRDGEVIDSKVFSNNGILLARGIISNEGKRQGKTIFYFEDGITVYATGDYLNNLKSGKWKYFYKTGKVEQEGSYNKDLTEGKWSWYYPDGSLKREEEFIAGKEDGLSTEYDALEKIISEGSYVEGEKEGLWEYSVGDHSEKGNYISGLRDGIWKYYYGNGEIQYEGKYIQGNPDGWVRLYYDDGKLMEEQFFVNGIRQKTWKKFDRSGNVLLAITYVDDVETRINGEKIVLADRDVKLIK